MIWVQEKEEKVVRITIRDCDTAVCWNVLLSSIFSEYASFTGYWQNSAYRVDAIIESERAAGQIEGNSIWFVQPDGTPLAPSEAGWLEPVAVTYSTASGRTLWYDGECITVDFGEGGSTNFADYLLRRLLEVQELPEEMQLGTGTRRFDAFLSLTASVDERPRVTVRHEAGPVSLKIEVPMYLVGFQQI